MYISSPLYSCRCGLYSLLHYILLSLSHILSFFSFSMQNIYVFLVNEGIDLCLKLMNLLPKVNEFGYVIIPILNQS